MFSLPTTPVEETLFYREVIQEGIKKGKAEGSLAEGRKFLRRQLRKRFGELPHWVEQKLLDVDVDTLEMWGEALLDADTLDGVFL
jgi:predicted transposase YdaD